MMQNLFKELAWKCYQNDLNFDYSEKTRGIDILAWDDRGNITTVSRGYIKDWNYETPTNALKRMHKEVDEHLEIESMEDTEFQSDNLTSYERCLRDSGHTEVDFYEGEFK